MSLVGVTVAGVISAGRSARGPSRVRTAEPTDRAHAASGFQPTALCPILRARFPGK
jgi:hypothetical protein